MQTKKNKTSKEGKKKKRGRKADAIDASDEPGVLATTALASSSLSLRLPGVLSSSCSWVLASDAFGRPPVSRETGKGVFLF